jgi:ABC-type multidrug transport system ATPase subunit
MNMPRLANKTAPDPHAFLEVRNLTVGYMPGLPVLNDLSVTASQPMVHLQGSNGSGKSTLLEVMAGILEPWEGFVRVNGHLPPTEQARKSRRICRAESALVPALTVRMQADLMCGTLGLPGGDLFKRLAKYGLQSWLDTAAADLSTGNLRKAWFVLSTAAPAGLMILDEPFNGLDADGVDAVVQDVQAWLEQGRKVMIVAHDLPEAITPDEQIILPTLRSNLAAHSGGRQ